MLGPLKPTLAVGVALAALGVSAVPAAAAPTASSLPTITGTGVYGSTLTCTNGTWSAGAGSFTYTWELADGNVPIGTGPTLRVRAPWVGLGIVCAVGATDTTGTATATSTSITAMPLIPTIRIISARQTTAGKIAISGTVSPTASLRGGAGSLILYRQTTSGPQQLSFNGRQTRPNAKTGAFTLEASGEPRGRNTYIVQYVPSALGYGMQVTVRRAITVT